MWRGGAPGLSGGIQGCRLQKQPEMGRGWQVTLNRKKTKSCLKHMTYNLAEKKRCLQLRKEVWVVQKNTKKTIQKNDVIN